MFTYQIKHAHSGLKETVVAGSVHYGTGDTSSAWVKFYAEPQPNREYSPVYAIRADVVASINRVSASTFLFHMTQSSRVEVNTGSSDGYYIFICKDDKNLTVNIPTAYWESVGKPNEFSMVLEPKNSSPVFASEKITVPSSWEPPLSSGHPDVMTITQFNAEQQFNSEQVGNTVSDRGKIVAQEEEIRRLNAELAAQKDPSAAAKEAAGTLVYRGDFDYDQIYYPNNVVMYKNDIYVVLTAVPQGTTPTNPSYSRYWGRFNADTIDPMIAESEK